MKLAYMEKVGNDIGSAYPAVMEGNKFLKVWMVNDRTNSPKVSKTGEEIPGTIDGRILCTYMIVNTTFLTEKYESNDPVTTIDKVSTQQDFIFDILKAKEIGKYFNNEDGPAFGALYFDPRTKTVEFPHKEYWINGDRVLDQEQQERMEHNGEFKNKVDDFFNS